MDPNNQNRKVDQKIRQIINEYRSAALFEDYADLFSFTDEVVKNDEKEKLEGIVGWGVTPSVRKKKNEEEKAEREGRKVTFGGTEEDGKKIGILTEEQIYKRRVEQQLN